MTVRYFQGFTAGFYDNLNPIGVPIDRGDDNVIGGSNAWFTEQGTWDKKPGMSRWSNQAIASDNSVLDFYNHIYSATVRVIVDREDDVIDLTSTSLTSFYTKPNNLRGSFVGAGDKLYFGFGDFISPDSTNPATHMRKRMPGSATTKQWGIDRPTIAPTYPDVDPTTGARVRIGWKYKYVWKDNVDGHLSSSSPASGTTGRRLHATFTVRVRGTSQPRVTHIDVYRTRDGGSTYYFLKSLVNPGTDTNVDTTDAAADETLNTALIAPGEHSNDPPPTNVLDLAYHANRIWAISGNTVRCTAYLTDVGGAANASLNGVPEECWPPDLLFQFNAPSKLLSTDKGLLIFTKHGDVYLISGTSKFDFDPQKIKEGIPVLWKNDACADGEIIYVYTGGRELLRISDSIELISNPLSESVLSNYVPGACFLTVRRLATKSALYFDSGNNRLFRFGISENTWSNEWLVDGSVVSHGPVRAMYTALGTMEVLYAPKAGVAGWVWKENHATHENDSVPYGWSLDFNVFTPVELNSQFRLLALYTEATRMPTVTFRMAEITGAASGTMVNVDEPPLQTTPSTISSKRHYPQTTAVSLVGRRFQPVLTWDAVNQADRLFGFGFEFDVVA